jgi:hypothetical protein
MKFSTAMCFALSGIELFYIAGYVKGERDLSIVVIPVAGIIVFLLMVSLLASTILGTNTGVEELFVKDSITAVGSVTPGRPAIPTMINFVLIGIAGNTVLAGFRFSGTMLRAIGLIAGAIGLSAVTGYILMIPCLYYSFKGISSAMAVHTAILFVLWGAGAVTVREKNK